MFLDSMDFLTLLILPLHEKSISFHLFVFSSFISVLQFSVYRSFTLVKFIPTYFIVFDAFINGIVFPSFSNSSF